MRVYFTCIFERFVFAATVNFLGNSDGRVAKRNEKA